LAVAYLDAGRPREAIETMHGAFNYPTSRVRWALWGVKSYYYLGFAYKQIGDTARAAEAFGEFLEYWGKTDVPIREVDDARRMLAELKTTG
jgi:predicted Zn-dependent protease